MKCFWRNQLTYIYFWFPTGYKFCFFLNSFTFSVCFSFLSHLRSVTIAGHILCNWMLQQSLGHKMFVINTWEGLRGHCTVRKTQWSCLNPVGFSELLPIRVVPPAWTQPCLRAPVSLCLGLWGYTPEVMNAVRPILKELATVASWGYKPFLMRDMWNPGPLQSGWKETCLYLTHKAISSL